MNYFLVVKRKVVLFLITLLLGFHGSPTPKEVHMTTKAPLTQSDLDQFYGSENYYRNFTGLIYTDGIAFLAEHAGAYWLIDAIGSHQLDPKLKKGGLRDMQFWNLKVNPDKSAILTCREDSGIAPAITQEISFTDFPLPEIDIWVGRDERGMIAMLTSEY